MEKIRHTLAHLLAQAAKEHYPSALLTLGPAVENGFYYDIDFGEDKINNEDLKKLEKTMKKKLSSWKEFKQKKVTDKEAKEYYKDNPYKLELIDGIISKGEDITLYTCGNFTDLCQGGHINHPAKNIPKDSFKLDRVAGAYWRGDEKNKMLTRIYGLSFENKEELEKYEKMRVEAEKRDHRKLGKRLKLFTFDEEIGKGLPLWLPKGNIIKEELEKWAKEVEAEWGYQRVTTPIITKENLFFTSGHLPLYKDSMYAPIEIEKENYYLKPMNCPFHHKIFSSSIRSYKELPLRLAEYGWCHRYEDSGSLFGLMRVRGMQMNDAHIYTPPEKAIDEFVEVIKLHEYMYKTLGIEKYEMELALRDPEKMDKYHGEEKDWKLAEKMTIEAMEKSGVPFRVENEGAAFYGPKMDFQIYSSIGRIFSASTNQLDLYMGKRFNLEYIDKDGNKKVPYIIHRAPLGTHERFIGFLIEHFAGNFPTWLSPVQVIILPISEKQVDYAKSIYKEIKKFRVELDDSAESLGKRIRTAKMQKVPYIIVIGDKEKDSKTITVETRTKKLETIKLEKFLERIEKEVSERTLN
ncbi:MAG: threonine--tRNA ligase [Patescibacteria group bacterium]|nr:threonine--tRNA ligase [Patescibacteria group bacterium]